jgi:outer membrane protein OmpA-like peptidoglycan-associated protein/outer membrane protein assembly factor BamB
MKLYRIIALCIFSLFSSVLFSQDWPIYKGNLYFTGNNDEIVVSNNNLKWLFQADERTFNPVVSDGRVYFLDQKADLYCLDEEYGRLLWKVDFQKISNQFKAFSKSAGKVKYPLIKGNTLFLSDPIAIYALDKRTGAVLWARTGMREENLPAAASGLSGRKPLPMVDGIYSDPVLHEDAIYYGTRNMFLARETRNGHESWQNRDIKTYSAYPTYYDDTIVTQSMDFQKNEYRVIRLDSQSGKEIWSKRIDKPERIFPPVIYGGKVYVPASKTLYCLNYKTGELLWMKDYGRDISSNPSFTDSAILFTLDNSEMAVIDPSNGAILKSVDLGKGSSPYFVTIRDMLYLAYNEKKTVGNKDLFYGAVKAVNFSDGKVLWSYPAPFPGPVSQPVASGGILFLPSGNYIYALGTEYYNKVVQGGDGFAVVDNGKSNDDSRRKKIDDALAAMDPGKKRNDTPQFSPEPDRTVKPIPSPSPFQAEEVKKIQMKELSLTVKDGKGGPVPAQVEIRKWEKGKLVYNEVKSVKGTETIKIPAGADVEITASSNGYLPKKEYLAGSESEKEITLDKIEKGKTFVVENINFEFGKAYLKKESINILDRVVRILKENGGLRITVNGHTDDIGDDAYNQKLSEKRADAVTSYMIKQGISPERVKAKGFGETKPLVPNTSDWNRAKNRRTEFMFE